MVDDKSIALLERALANIENEYRPTCESASYGSGCPGPTDASLDFWRRAADCVPAMLTELRQSRAAALSAEEIEALRWLREWVEPRLDLPSDKDASCEHCLHGHAAIATIDRLLSTHGKAG